MPIYFSRVQRVLLLVEINSSGKFIVYNAITNSQTKLIRFDFTSEKCFERTLFQITWIRVINLDEILIGIIDKLNVDWYIVIP